jgi:phenylacetic acid degradation operon negative regulatory protein
MRCTDPIPFRVFLALLGELDVSEMAGRATLTRLVRKGFLERTRKGRSAAFAASTWIRDLLARDRRRAVSPHPFDHRTIAGRC